MQEAAVKCLFAIVYGPIGGGGDLTGVAIPAAQLPQVVLSRLLLVAAAAAATQLPVL